MRIPEARQIMCKAMEDMKKDAADRRLVDAIKSLMESMKLTAEQAMKALNVSTEEQGRVIKML